MQLTKSVNGSGEWNSSVLLSKLSQVVLTPSVDGDGKMAKRVQADGQEIECLSGNGW